MLLGSITQGTRGLAHAARAPQNANLAHQTRFAQAAQLVIGLVQLIAPSVLLLALLVTPQELTAFLVQMVISSMGTPVIHAQPSRIA